MIPTISPYLLPQITPVLRARYPQLTAIWTEDKTPLLVSSLASGGLDAALAAGRPVHHLHRSPAQADADLP